MSMHIDPSIDRGDVHPAHAPATAKAKVESPKGVSGRVRAAFASIGSLMSHDAPKFTAKQALKMSDVFIRGHAQRIPPKEEFMRLFLEDPTLVLSKEELAKGGPVKPLLEKAFLGLSSLSKSQVDSFAKAFTKAGYPDQAKALQRLYATYQESSKKLVALDKSLSERAAQIDREVTKDVKENPDLTPDQIKEARAAWIHSDKGVEYLQLLKDTHALAKEWGVLSGNLHKIVQHHHLNLPGEVVLNTRPTTPSTPLPETSEAKAHLMPFFDSIKSWAAETDKEALKANLLFIHERVTEISSLPEPQKSETIASLPQEQIPGMLFIQDVFLSGKAPAADAPADRFVSLFINAATTVLSKEIQAVGENLTPQGKNELSRALKQDLKEVFALTPSIAKDRLSSHLEVVKSWSTLSEDEDFEGVKDLLETTRTSSKDTARLDIDTSFIKAMLDQAGVDENTDPREYLRLFNKTAAEQLSKEFLKLYEAADRNTKSALADEFKKDFGQLAVNILPVKWRSSVTFDALGRLQGKSKDAIAKDLRERILALNIIKKEHPALMAAFAKVSPQHRLYKDFLKFTSIEPIIDALKNSGKFSELLGACGSVLSLNPKWKGHKKWKATMAVNRQIITPELVSTFMPKTTNEQERTLYFLELTKRTPMMAVIETFLQLHPTSEFSIAYKNALKSEFARNEMLGPLTKEEWGEAKMWFADKLITGSGPKKTHIMFPELVKLLPASFIPTE